MKAKKTILLLVVALLLGISARVLLITQLRVNNIDQDGVHYYTVAVNLINHNAYSIDAAAPYKPLYVREPGISYYYAACLFIGQLLGVLPELDFPEFSDVSGTAAIKAITDKHQNAILWIKVCNVGLQILVSAVFLFMVRMFFDKTIVILMAFVLALYYPFMYSSVNILRELPCTLGIMVFSLAWLLFNRKGNLCWCAAAGLLWGLLTLTFQVYIVLGGLPLLVYGAQQRSFRKFFIASFVMCGLFVLTLAPWLFRVYRYYPDWRIAKTAGCAYTHEYSAYVGAVRSASKSAKIAEAETIEPDFIYTDAATLFKQSFDGHYRNEAKRIRVELPAKDRVIQVIRCFKNTFFVANIYDSLELFRGKCSVGALLKVAAVCGVILVGCLSILGICHSPSLLVCFPAVLYHLLLFSYIASQPRRQLPIMPFLLLFAYLGWQIICKYFKRRRKAFVKEGFGNLEDTR